MSPLGWKTKPRRQRSTRMGAGIPPRPGGLLGLQGLGTHFEGRLAAQILVGHALLDFQWAAMPYSAV